MRLLALCTSVVFFVLISRSGRAEATEIELDNFENATLTDELQLTSPTPIPPAPAISTSATDSGLVGVIGGCRTVMLQATELQTNFDNVTATAGLEGMFLHYSSTLTGKGSVMLLYDACGSGLNTSNFAPTDGFQIDVLVADAASVGSTVTLTLTDHNSNQASATQTITAPGALTISFLAKQFAGVNLQDLFSIKLTVAAPRAADLKFQLFRTFTPEGFPGTCTDNIDNDHNGLTDCADPACVNNVACEPRMAPTASDGGLGLLMIAMMGVGALGLRRTAAN